MLLRASLALGYILMSWRHTREVFIPKPGKPLSQQSLRDPSLSCLLYSKHVRNYLIGILGMVSWLKKQYAYKTGMSTETTLFQVVRRLEKSSSHKEIALGAFLDIEESFSNILFNAITTAARECGLEETCCRWVRSMLESRLVHTSLMGSSFNAQVVGGCPQGGVLTPLLWNFCC